MEVGRASVASRRYAARGLNKETENKWKMMMSDLLPCPFCGKEPFLIKIDEWFTITCKSCRSKMRYRYKEDVINNWNDRTKPENDDV